jgi:hypothetical protein
LLPIKTKPLPTLKKSQHQLAKLIKSNFQYLTRADQMQSDSDQEFQSFLQDVRFKWSQLNEQTRKELRVYDPATIAMIEKEVKQQKFSFGV